MVLMASNDKWKNTMYGFRSINHFLNKAVDILVADLLYTLPYAIKWFYRISVKHKTTSFLICHRINGKNIKAYLYLHGNLDTQSNMETSVVLLLHGRYGHPLSLLHLADIAKRARKGPVFSVYLPYDECRPETHRFLLKQAIDEIERMIIEKGGRLRGLVTVGHSLGAIESAYRAFVDRDERILAVISIAGRLKVVPSQDKPCHECLRLTVDNIYRGIQKYQNLPLYQIVAGQDWNAPLEATAVRPHKDYCYIVKDAMHLNVLYRDETRRKFDEFLKSSIS